MEKLLFIDTETTGTDPMQHGVIQIAGMVIIDDEVKEKFDYKIKPFSKDVIDEKALEITRTNRADLFDETRLYPRKAYLAFVEVLESYVDKFVSKDKFQFVGYNANFDMRFLREFFRKNSDNYFGSFCFFPPLDVMSLAAFHFKRERSKLENFKLLTVAKALQLQIDESKAHDAFYDIELTKSVFDLLTK